MRVFSSRSAKRRALQRDILVLRALDLCLAFAGATVVVFIIADWLFSALFGLVFVLISLGLYALFMARWPATFLRSMRLMVACMAVMVAVDSTLTFLMVYRGGMSIGEAFVWIALFNAAGIWSLRSLRRYITGRLWGHHDE
ncbi:MAG: hypothetical protein Q4A71_01480 [Actinomycetaceae bacterium]|nr:hypothetical protein [Actinomycetaceae bacterium]